MAKSKQLELGEWIFEINLYDVDKATVLLPELLCILSKPISNAVDKFKGDLMQRGEEGALSRNIIEHAGTIFESLDLLFTGYLKPADVPAFLKRVLEDVRCKKDGKMMALSGVYNNVFAGRVMDQFLLAKEVLIFNFKDELERFFGLLLGSSGTTEEAKAQSPVTLSQPVTIRAR